MATHSSTLAWRIPWTEEPGRLQSMGSQESDTTEQLNHRHHGDSLYFLNNFSLTLKLLQHIFSLKNILRNIQNSYPGKTPR